MSRTLIVAYVFVEERFAHVKGADPARLVWREIGNLAALPISEGGLGRRILPIVARTRSADYGRRLTAALTEIQSDEGLRRIDLADIEARNAHAALIDSEPGTPARREAERRHAHAWREEARLHGLADFDRPAPPPRLAQWMHDAAAATVALEVRDALEVFPEDERSHLRRTLNLD
jgi:hypothetical protein